MFQSIGQLPDYTAGIDAALQKTAAAPKPTTGMFGGGKFGWKEALMGALAGFMSRRNPGAAQGLMAIMQQRQAAQQDEQQRQQEREDGWEDFVRKETFKRANPAPVNNDTVADYEFIRSTLGDDEAANYLKNKANPPLLMNIPGVGVVQVPRQGGQAPQAPVGRLTPIDEGGPGLGGPGTFPY